MTREEAIKVLEMFYFLPDEEPTVEFDFRFRTEDPASLFDDIRLEEFSIKKAF